MGVLVVAHMHGIRVEARGPPCGVAFSPSAVRVPGDRTQVIEPGNKHLGLLSHLFDPSGAVSRVQKIVPVGI